MPQRDDIDRGDEARNRRCDPKHVGPGSTCFAVHPRRVAAYPKPSPPITGFTPPIPGCFFARQGFSNRGDEWVRFAGGSAEEIDLVPASTWKLPPDELDRLFGEARPIDGCSNLVRPAPLETEKAQRRGILGDEPRDEEVENEAARDIGKAGQIELRQRRRGPVGFRRVEPAPAEDRDKTAGDEVVVEAAHAILHTREEVVSRQQSTT